VSIVTLRHWIGYGCLAVLAAGLYIAYLHMSQAYPENSDEANILLMASDMRHGNLLLHGWDVSDVPFFTTELPQIALLVAAFGLRLGTAHVAAAMTYTMVVLTAMALARGRAAGAAAIARMLIALGIMLAPQPGVGTFVLLLSVGHIGTALPVMLTWLAAERVAGTARLSLGYALVALMLAWSLTADPLVTVIAVLPLAMAGVIRREWRLVASAGTGYLLALGATRLIGALGGYKQEAVPYAVTAPATWPRHCRVTAHGLLEMWGAYDVPGARLDGQDAAIAVVHVVGVALAVWAALAAARRFFRRDADVVSQLLLAGIAGNLAAFVPSTLASASALNAREIAPVLPLAAVLAGRVLGDRLAAGIASPRPPRRMASRIAAALLALAAAGYCYGLGVHAAQAPARDPYTGVEAYLERHHLSYGLSGYWQSSYITVDTGGRVTLRAVTAACAQPYLWESRPAWYRRVPGHPATFILSSTVPGFFHQFQPTGATLRQLGVWFPNVRPLTFGWTRVAGGLVTASYTAGVYPADLMSQLPRLKAALQSANRRCG
jgi:hypothetical protein